MMFASLVLALAQTPVQQPPEVIDRRPLGDGLVLMTHEVRDLLPQVAPPAGVSWSSEEWEQEGRKARQPAIDALTEMIKAEIQPPDKSRGAWSLRITPNGTLVLHASPAQHEWVMQFLERNRTQERFCLAEASWIVGPKGSFTRMGIAAAPASTILAEADRARLLAACGEDAKRFSVISVPRLVNRPLAEGTCSVGKELAYIKDFKLQTVEPGNQQIADPEIPTIFEGLRMRVFCALLEDTHVALDLEASNCVVKRPIPTKNLKLVPEIEHEVTISLPEVDIKSIHARCTLEKEGAVAFLSPMANEPEKEILILVRARQLTAAERGALPKEAVAPVGPKQQKQDAESGGIGIRPR